ncbi:MAG TPA: hypothetical protein VNG90_00710 [Candidatus Acidoferrum sp.]|nr:hypothetical protein [Candidatus Acidoferrum sp.]
MKVMMFYRPNTEDDLKVADYVREFLFRTGKSLPIVDVDSREGIAMCETYDILYFPTILAVDDQGRELQRWNGEMMPQISEVSYYMQDQPASFATAGSGSVSSF